MTEAEVIIPNSVYEAIITLTSKPDQDITHTRTHTHTNKPDHYLSLIHMYRFSTK